MGAIHALPRVLEDVREQYDAGDKPVAFTILPEPVRKFAAARKDPFITQVYVTLAAHANRAGVCWPSQPRIAEESGISERKVRHIIAVLVNAGIIRADRKSHATIYTLVPSDQIPAIDSTSDRHVVPPSDNKDDRDRHNVPPHDRQEMPDDRHHVPTDRHDVPVRVAPRAAKLESRTKTKNQNDIPPSAATPYLLFAAMCEEQGVDPSAVGTADKNKQMAVTKRLAAAGMTDDDMRRFIRWASPWASGIDAFFVEKQRTRWQMAGSPGEPERKQPEKRRAHNDPKSGKLVY